MKVADGKKQLRSKQEQGATAINHSDIYQIGLGVEALSLGTIRRTCCMLIKVRKALTSANKSSCSTQQQPNPLGKTNFIDINVRRLQECVEHLKIYNTGGVCACSLLFFSPLYATAVRRRSAAGGNK
ncbi:hypothetical protein XENOCAPTIV_019606 [Xenoophorus captivus]|uniref:Uncharacterized protein n=2 Tax=Goodeidae TaxID=28758 RepID=A0ABV0QAS1_9TELE|nr:hypothetical protein [Ataeniobius toweri]